MPDGCIEPCKFLEYSCQILHCIYEIQLVVSLQCGLQKQNMLHSSQIYVFFFRQLSVSCKKYSRSAAAVPNATLQPVSAISPHPVLYGSVRTFRGLHAKSWADQSCIEAALIVPKEDCILGTPASFTVIALRGKNLSEAFQAIYLLQERVVNGNQ